MNADRLIMRASDGMDAIRPLSNGERLARFYAEFFTHATDDALSHRCTANFDKVKTTREHDADNGGQRTPFAGRIGSAPVSCDERRGLSAGERYAANECAAAQSADYYEDCIDYG